MEVDTISPSMSDSEQKWSQPHDSFYPGLYLALSLCRKNPVKGLDCFDVGRHVRRRVPPDIRVTAYFRSKQTDLLWVE